MFFNNKNQVTVSWDDHSKDTYEHIDCKWSLKGSIIYLNFDLYGFYNFRKVDSPIRYKIIEMTDHTLELRNLESPDALNFYILMYNEYNSMYNKLKAKH